MRLLLIVVLIGCGGKPPPATLADACYDLASTLCSRIEQCGALTGTIGQCRTDGVAACCFGADCSTPVLDCRTGKRCCVDASCSREGADLEHVTAVFGACDAAVRQLTCGQLAAGLKPAACAPGAADGGG